MKTTLSAILLLSLSFAASAQGILKCGYKISEMGRGQVEEGEFSKPLKEFTKRGEGRTSLFYSRNYSVTAWLEKNRDVQFRVAYSYYAADPVATVTLSQKQLAQGINKFGLGEVDEIALECRIK